jgi:thioredoxin-like negative regulator of GroEL
MSDQIENTTTRMSPLPILIPAMKFCVEVLHPKEPVLVEFFAPWSRACQVFDSVLQEVAAACAGKVKVVKVNADDCLDLSLAYDIQSVPTLLCFLAGNPRWRIVGTATSGAIQSKLKSLL